MKRRRLLHDADEYYYAQATTVSYFSCLCWTFWWLYYIDCTDPWLLVGCGSFILLNDWSLGMHISEVYTLCSNYLTKLLHFWTWKKCDVHVLYITVICHNIPLCVLDLSGLSSKCIFEVTPRMVICTSVTTESVSHKPAAPGSDWPNGRKELIFFCCVSIFFYTHTEIWSF